MGIRIVLPMSWHRLVLWMTMMLLVLSLSQQNENVQLKQKHQLDLFELDWDHLPIEIFLPPDSSSSSTSSSSDLRGEEDSFSDWFSFDFSSFSSIFSSPLDSSSSPQTSTNNNDATISNYYNEVSTIFSSKFASNHNLNTKPTNKIPSMSTPAQLRSTQARKLQTKGSNCILIERGKVPRYYDCNGCVIDRAQACIDDLRGNKSHNVHPDCLFKAASVRYLGACCPKVELMNGRYNLQYLTAAYPMALRCLEEVHCSDSTLYSQLEQECMKTCPQSDRRTGSNVCHAQFNAAFSLVPRTRLASVVFGTTVLVAMSTLLAL